MKHAFLFALVMILAALPAAALYYGYVPAYGGFGHDYERSRTSESVNVRESEYQSSWSDYGGRRYYHDTGRYDYGRSRDFSFSRTDDYERESSSGGYGFPSGAYSRGYAGYYYPYVDAGTSYGRDYRPFSDYYELGFTSPYYNPARYSRVGAYASRYPPYGY